MDMGSPNNFTSTSGSVIGILVSTFASPKISKAMMILLQAEINTAFNPIYEFCILKYFY